MWNKIQYALIYSWVKVHALLPMLYILSDILYVLVYKVVRYRVKSRQANMKASFPDKSDTELRRLETAAYHHLPTTWSRRSSLPNISLEESNAGLFLKIPKLVDTLGWRKGTPVLSSWMGMTWQLGMVFRLDFPFQGFRIYQICRPTTRHSIACFLTCVRIRSSIKKQDTVRDVITLKKQTRCVVIFIADQTPSRNNSALLDELPS